MDTSIAEYISVGGEHSGWREGGLDSITHPEHARAVEFLLFFRHNGHKL